MWPKFSAKVEDEKPLPFVLDLQPLRADEAEKPIPRPPKKSRKSIILRLLAVVLVVAIFGVALYNVLQHMAHCWRWHANFSDQKYAKFYENYVFPSAGDGERTNEFVQNMYLQIYDGEYDVPENFEEYRQRFKEYLKKYDKSYTAYEEEYRFRVFVHNVVEFEMEESRNPWVDLDETPFTDWTNAELKKILSANGDLNGMEGSERFEGNLYKEGESRPLQVDWRSKGKVTPVKDQKQCGSCWAFSVVAAVEAQYAIKNSKQVLLSEQQLVDCDSRNNGCHGGYRPYAMSYVISHGLFPQDVYPYTATEGNQCKLINQTKVFISDYKMLSSNEETVADWVAQNGPVTFGMKVVKQMYNYRNGVFEPSREDCEQKSMGSHALTIVGFGSESGRDYWLVKNSWGSYWGQSGYFKLARGVNACGAADIVVAPIIN